MKKCVFAALLCAMCLFQSVAGVSVYQIKDGRADVYCDGSDVVARVRVKSLDVELGRLKKAAKRGKNRDSRRCRRGALSLHVQHCQGLEGNRLD